MFILVKLLIALTLAAWFVAVVVMAKRGDVTVYADYGDIVFCLACVALPLLLGVFAGFRRGAEGNIMALLILALLLGALIYNFLICQWLNDGYFLKPVSVFFVRVALPFFVVYGVDELAAVKFSFQAAAFALISFIFMAALAKNIKFSDPLKYLLPSFVKSRKEA